MDRIQSAYEESVFYVSNKGHEMVISNIMTCFKWPTSTETTTNSSLNPTQLGEYKRALARSFLGEEVPCNFLNLFGQTKLEYAEDAALWNTCNVYIRQSDSVQFVIKKYLEQDISNEQQTAQSDANNFLDEQQTDPIDRIGESNSFRKVLESLLHDMTACDSGDFTADFSVTIFFNSILKGFFIDFFYNKEKQGEMAEVFTVLYEKILSFLKSNEITAEEKQKTGIYLLCLLKIALPELELSWSEGSIKWMMDHYKCFMLAASLILGCLLIIPCVMYALPAWIASPFWCLLDYSMTAF